jgi:hypothetical protein
MQWSSLRPFSIAVALPARAEGECFNFCYSCQIVAFSACLLLSARTRLEVELHSTFLSWPRDWFFTRLKSFAPPAQAKRLQWKMAFRLVVLKVKIVLRFMFSPNYFHSVLPYTFSSPEILGLSCGVPLHPTTHGYSWSRNVPLHANAQTNRILVHYFPHLNFKVYGFSWSRNVPLHANAQTNRILVYSFPPFNHD